ncbi:MAG: hypothetical protein WA733_12435 [Methylocystis sp.]
MAIALPEVKVNAHFRHAFADRLTVTKVTDRRRNAALVSRAGSMICAAAMTMPIDGKHDSPAKRRN